MKSATHFWRRVIFLILGLVAYEMEHYDEALASLNQAANFARPIQARVVLEAALGASGGTYFLLGDFEKALVQVFSRLNGNHEK